MVRKKEILIYDFDELSEKAKEHAIELLVDDGKAWTDSDAEDLSETFKNDLADHYGLGYMDVCWSLGYTQGDGVAFWGNVDMEKFVETEIEMKVKTPEVERFRKIVPFVKAKVTNEGRDCHEMSMRLEFDLYGGPEDLIPDPVGQEYMEWQHQAKMTLRYWMEEKSRIIAARRDPITYWKEQRARWEKQKRRPFGGKESPKAWVPGEPGPMPAELNLEIPPEPSQAMPVHLRAALDLAEVDWVVVEKIAIEFEVYLLERIREISRELEAAGYNEIEYLSSREFMEQRIEGRGWKFLEDGRRYKE